MQGEAFAQTKNYVITGKVTDARTKEPIPGTVVKMQNSNFATSANAEGVFNLNASLSPGKYQIVFSFLGNS